MHFWILRVAKNLGLFYFGFLAVLGELTCLTVAVVVLSAALLAWRRRKENGAAANGGALAGPWPPDARSEPAYSALLSLRSPAAMTS